MATPEIYTLSLHDALPILQRWRKGRLKVVGKFLRVEAQIDQLRHFLPLVERSEEHTSELQSHHDLVCRLLLEKKKIHCRLAPPPLLISCSLWSNVAASLTL